MMRTFLCLSLTAVFAVMFVSAVSAQQQGHGDVQSLQYEFGKNVQPHVQAPAYSSQPQVQHMPVERSYCYTACRPCYTPCYNPCYAPYYPVRYRRVLMRPLFYPPYYGCW